MKSRALHKILQPVYRRIRLLLRRGVLTGSNSSPMMQVVQVKMTSDLTLEMEHFEPYGFSSNPQNGAEPIVGNIEGKSHPVSLIIADRRYRLQTMAKGEVAISTDEGDVIHFKRGNHIYIDAMNKVTVQAPNVDIIASTKVTIDAPLAEFTGDVDITGEATIGGIDFTTHIHGGVASGGNTTGDPQ